MKQNYYHTCLVQVQNIIISAGDNNHNNRRKNKKQKTIMENGVMQWENANHLVGARDKFLQSLHSFCYPLST